MSFHHINCCTCIKVYGSVVDVLCIRQYELILEIISFHIVLQIGSVLPSLVHLFRPTQTTLTLKALIQILKPKFSEEGSNSRRLENSVYSAYLKYLRAVASKYEYASY